jgi:uncharacterized protein (DUF362 family)
MSLENFLNSIDRRTFLRLATVTGIGSFIYPKNVISHMLLAPKSRIVIVEDSAATNGMTIDSAAVQIMVESGIKTLAEQDDIGDAWKLLLNGVDQTSTIAIKVNCINSALSTHPEVTYAVANSLTRMLFDDVPFPENNIIIFDRTSGELTSAGYTLNTSETGIRCFGTNTSGVGYSTETYDVNGRNQTLSKIVTEYCDFLVNLSVLKNHTTAGVTLCLKNHYGTCNSPGNLHGDYANPYIPSLNSQDPILLKQVVNICDALFGIYSGGPSGLPQFTENKIIFSQDIVAVDYIGRSILEDHGSNTINRAGHVDAAATDYQLGTNDLQMMDQITILNPTTTIRTPREEDPAIPQRFVLKQNYPNPFNNTTQIEFYLAKPGDVIMDIFDDRGRQVKNLANKTVRSGWHRITWDGTNDAGRQVASGLYVTRLRSADFQKAMIMQLIK